MISSIKGSCKIAIVAFLMAMSPGMALAEAYSEFAVLSGGESIASTADEDLYLAGGFRFAFGIQHAIGGSERREMLYTLGYLWDEITASNGRGDFDVLVVDIVYQVKNGPHRFGYGGSYHINPEYKEKVDGFAPFRLEFDDALGFTARYSYTFDDVFMVGGVVNIMDYEADGESFDATGIGVYMASYF